MNQKTFATHPIYVDYEASRDGVVRNKINMTPIGTIDNLVICKLLFMLIKR